MAQAGNPLGILGHKKAVPSADDLLSIKLLNETDPDFAHLREESTLFLKNAMRMLAASPFLRTKFGGDGVAEASVLANLIKQRADTLNFQLHVDDMSRQLLNREFAKVNMNGLRPKALPVYGPNGEKIRDPINMLGLRFIRNAGVANANRVRAIVGSEELNAYGNTWYRIPARGGQPDVAALGINVNPHWDNYWDRRNNYRHANHFLADRNYAYGPG